jgi:Cys-rich protein (TIGR01571 family)
VRPSAFHAGMPPKVHRASSIVVLSEHNEQFNESLFGCAESPQICCDEIICCYCHIGNIYDFVEGGRSINYAACCGPLCLDVLCTLGCARLVMTTILRDNIVRKYQLKEDRCMSCLTAWFCSWCSMCQVHREILSRYEVCNGCVYQDTSHRAPPTVVMAGGREMATIQSGPRGNQGSGKVHQPSNFGPNYYGHGSGVYGQPQQTGFYGAPPNQQHNAFYPQAEVVHTPQHEYPPHPNYVSNSGYAQQPGYSYQPQQGGYPPNSQAHGNNSYPSKRAA